MKKLHITRMSGAGQGKVQDYTQSPVSLGTAPGCDLKFDPSWDKSVSGRHAFIEWVNDEWIVRDAGSQHGTLINGKRLDSSQPIGDGIEIELGAGGPRIKAAVAAAPVSQSKNVTADPGVDSGAGKSKPRTPVLASSLLVPISIAALLVAVLIGGYFLWLKGSQLDIDDQVIAAARKYENCVALVVLSGKNQQGEPTTVPMATAWAISENALATNSHVTTPVKEHLANGGAAFVVINKNPELRFRIVESVVHPKYGKEHLNIDGKNSAIPAYDVGILKVEGSLPNHFQIAADGELEQLDSGYRVAYLGFPMEGIAGGGVDYHSPVATMQSGIITANTDYWLSKASFAERRLVAHNLGATGGSSGSPVFNARGEVVAILSAGNIIGQIKIVNGQIGMQRAPSGVMINYAQRVDLLRDIWDGYDKVSGEGGQESKEGGQ